MGNMGSSGSNSRRRHGGGGGSGRRIHTPPQPVMPPPEITANRFAYPASATPYHNYHGYYPPPFPAPYDDSHHRQAVEPMWGQYPPAPLPATLPVPSTLPETVPVPSTVPETVPAPYVEHQKAVTIYNGVNIKKETLRIEADEENPGRFLVSFTVEAIVSGRLALTLVVATSLRRAGRHRTRLALTLVVALVFVAQGFFPPLVSVMYSCCVCPFPLVLKALVSCVPFSPDGVYSDLVTALVGQAVYCHELCYIANRVFISFYHDDSITIFFFAKEEEGGTLTPMKENVLPPVTVNFQQGLGQKFKQPAGTGIDFSILEESELLNVGDMDVYPVVIKADASSGNTNSEMTQAVFEKEKGEFQVKVVKQLLWINGIRYEVRDIYGSGNSLEGDWDGNDTGKACVICLSEPRDTTCMCSGCAKVLRFKTKRCPVCRQPIETLVEMPVPEPQPKE
ncbi:hypothetical protein Fmac_027645 [Flemingia macrophylla]|uniref:RING-type E3 ubiquitin transferase n=1 Tax=Flemingia macrophylla TaxID=520843 RepID=A0ABD1LIF9_9FABA